MHFGGAVLCPKVGLGHPKRLAPTLNATRVGLWSTMLFTMYMNGIGMIRWGFIKWLWYIPYFYKNLCLYLFREFSKITFLIEFSVITRVIYTNDLF